MNLKDHSLWFWGCLFVWCAYAVPRVIDAISIDQVHHGALAGAIVGVLFVGYIGYVVLKWIYDKLTKEKPTTATTEGDLK